MIECFVTPQVDDFRLGYVSGLTHNTVNYSVFCRWYLTHLVETAAKPRLCANFTVLWIYSNSEKTKNPKIQNSETYVWFGLIFCFWFSQCFLFY